MAAAPVDMGFGLTMTYNSTFFSYIRVVSVNNITRAAIDTTHNGTSSGNATFIPSDIKDWGSIQVEGLFDHNTPPPIDDAAESVTITYPLAGSETVAATWAGSAFMTDFQQSAPYDGVCTFSATLKFSGAITVTAAT